MAMVTLTARYLDQLKPQRRRYEVFDTLVPGFAVRVSPSGHKTFTLYYRHMGRMRRVGLGRYPDVLLADARKDATQKRGRIFDGADPAGEKQAQRATHGDTVGALFDLYKEHREHAKSWSETRRIMEREVLPTWRHMRVADLRRRDVRELVERKAQCAPVMANRILSRISAMLTFAMGQDWIETNPAWRIRKPGEERTRDRVLSRDELSELWAALHQTAAKDANGRTLPRLSQTLNDAFIVLLLTAQRGGEVWRMRWEDVDLTSGWWTIPGEDAKNGDPHRVPLTAIVLEILKRRFDDRDDRYVFSNHRHTCIAARAKKAAAILCNTKKGGLSFDFRAHDLRRTAASYMAEAGVDRFHIAHVLNHRSVTHSTVTAIYDRYRYDKERRAALEKWAEVLKSIVGRPARAAKAATAPSPADAVSAPRPRSEPRHVEHCRIVPFTPKRMPNPTAAPPA